MSSSSSSSSDSPSSSCCTDTLRSESESKIPSSTTPSSSSISSISSSRSLSTVSTMDQSLLTHYSEIMSTPQPSRITLSIAQQHRHHAENTISYLSECMRFENNDINKRMLSLSTCIRSIIINQNETSREIDNVNVDGMSVLPNMVVFLRQDRIAFLFWWHIHFIAWTHVQPLTVNSIEYALRYELITSLVKIYPYTKCMLQASLWIINNKPPLEKNRYEMWKWSIDFHNSTHLNKRECNIYQYTRQWDLLFQEDHHTINDGDDKEDVKILMQKTNVIQIPIRNWSFKFWELYHFLCHLSKPSHLLDVRMHDLLGIIFNYLQKTPCGTCELTGSWIVRTLPQPSLTTMTTTTSSPEIHERNWDWGVQFHNRVLFKIHQNRLENILLECFSNYYSTISTCSLYMDFKAIPTIETMQAEDKSRKDETLVGEKELDDDDYDDDYDEEKEENELIMTDEEQQEILNELQHMDLHYIREICHLIVLYSLEAESCLQNPTMMTTFWMNHFYK